MASFYFILCEAMSWEEGRRGGGDEREKGVSEGPRKSADQRRRDESLEGPRERIPVGEVEDSNVLSSDNSRFDVRALIYGRERGGSREVWGVTLGVGVVLFRSRAPGSRRRKTQAPTT